MIDHAEGQARLVALLRESGVAPARVIAAFGRVARHHFLPGVEPEAVYVDDAVVTRIEDRGIPTSSSSQPTLMAAMLAALDVRPGDRVLEVGTGTGFNAALLADLAGPEGQVTSVELQPEVAEAARENLRTAGGEGGGAAGPGAAGREGSRGGAAPVEVVCADGAHPPGGPYDRIMVTAGCWSLPPALVGALKDGGVLVAPLRVNGVEVAVPLRREGQVLAGTGGVPCGFMPMRGGPERPWRWELGTGGGAAADADLGTEGRGAVDRLLAVPARPLPDPDLGAGGPDLDALMWLGLRGDPLITIVRAWPAPGERPPWLVGLASLPGSLLIFELDRGGGALHGLELHGGDAALRAATTGLDAWRAAGSPGARDMHVTVEPHPGRDLGGLPAPLPGGVAGADVQRGVHRWTFRYPDP
jgi:protein-L-isoaspartate(D-aspartate) O-methyltransferase